MIASLILIATILVLGAPAAVVLIPWTMVTRNATPLYNVSLAIVRVALRLAGIRVVTRGLENVPPHTACPPTRSGRTTPAIARGWHG